MRHGQQIGWLIAGAALSGGVLAFAPISGELDPPAGPVSETTPSLSDLSDGLEALLIGFENSSGPWESFTIQQADLGQFDGESVQIASGRVHVRSVVVFQANVSLFDGAGEISANNIVLDGTRIGAASSRWSNGGAGRGQSTSVQTLIDVETVDGLEISFVAPAGDGYAVVYYRQHSP